MRFDTSQQMRVSQQMRLAPRVIQSMEILQLALPALQERIEQELESNVTLEMLEPNGAPATQEQDSDASRLDDGVLDIGDETHDFERLEAYETGYTEASENEYSAARSKDLRTTDRRMTSASSAGERDGKMDAMANAAARGESLEEQLMHQWGLADMDDRRRALGELLIASIDEDGFVRAPLEEIAVNAPAEISPVDPEELEDALYLLQSVLDPPGVAARDTHEALLLQLDALQMEAPQTDFSVVRTLIEDHYDDLLQNRLPKIVEATNLPMERITEAIASMRRLDPAPGRRLVDEAPQILIPDAIVEFDDEEDRYIAYLNDRMLPNLRINKSYAKMVRDQETDQKTRDFIRTNLSNAEWLLDAVEQRKRTLLRVLNVVTNAQRDFFDEGPEALRPLPMTQVAEQLGVHVATVSRAVSGKHIQTPRGVFALRRFFSGGVQTEGGEDMSWDAIRAALQDVIDKEDKSNPLSDEALARELRERGIDIARRTIAKYRAQLNVPSARMRKQYA